MSAVKQQRSAFQGTLQILRFNRHYYFLSLLFAGGCLYLGWYQDGIIEILGFSLASLLLLLMFNSLLVSCWVYDCSPLYRFQWLHKLKVPEGARLLHLHFGLDESSAAIAAAFPQAELVVYDLFDAASHTEASLQQARVEQQAASATRADASHLPESDQSCAAVLLIFAAHEIRQQEKRTALFQEVRRVLDDQGQVLVLEHLRDLPNLLAYTIGAMHFFPKSSWMRVFKASELQIVETFKITPFVTGFILEKDGTAS